MSRTKQYCLSLSVSNLCLFIRAKNLTLKTCAPDFSARSMTKLYAKIRGPRAVSLFDFLETWQVFNTFNHHDIVAEHFHPTENFKLLLYSAILSLITILL